MSRAQRSHEIAENARKAITIKYNRHKSELSQFLLDEVYAVIDNNAGVGSKKVVFQWKNLLDRMNGKFNCKITITEEPFDPQQFEYRMYISPEQFAKNCDEALKILKEDGYTVSLCDDNVVITF